MPLYHLQETCWNTYLYVLFHLQVTLHHFSACVLFETKLLENIVMCIISMEPFNIYSTCVLFARNILANILHVYSLHGTLQHL